LASRLSRRERTAKEKGAVEVTHRKIAALLISAVLALGLVGVSPAGAATSFGSCDRMHRTWQYGVAKSRRAARKQVNSGHYKPHVSYSIYVANKSLDADKDGTACEVSR
jgi:hypothetical protein